MLAIWTPPSKFPPACQYYRIEVPSRTLLDLGHDVGNGGENDSMDLIVKSAFIADVVPLYIPDRPQEWSQFATAARSMPPVVSPEGQSKFPPVFVYDADDNTDFASPFNDSFILNGVHDLDGNRLKPGDSVGVHTPAGDTVLWEDKVSESNGRMFDIEMNLKRMDVRRKLIRSCDGATACSPQLASYWRDALGQKNVYVYHNTVIPKDYDYGVRAIRTDPDNIIRILWQGGQSHVHDWYALAEPLQTVLRKYPNAKFVCMGSVPKFLRDGIDPSQIEYIPWTHYEAYRLRRTLLNVDINLCPLADSLFNRCKSAIKWYESTVSHNVEATLAQATGPYLEIEDGKTGLLFKTPEEFVQKLSTLIEDADLRRRLGHGAKEWVWNNRLPEHTTPGLVAFYEELKAQQASRLAPKIITTVPRSLKELVGGTT